MVRQSGDHAGNCQIMTETNKQHMKITPSKTTHYSHCLPPEAYMRLWNASVETQQTPRFQSTYTPKKK